MTWLAVGIYAAFLLLMVVRLMGRKAGNAPDYILAGRTLTLPAFTASLVTTWYGGILGVGEYTWRHGVSNWLVFGVPYYLYALIFAFFLARRARRAEVLTIPDLLHQRYGRSAALLGAGTLFVMTAPAAYVLMLGVLIGMVTGWPLWVGVILGTALSVGYVFRGGLRAVVTTDLIQFVLMFLAFLVLVPVCVETWGGWDFLVTRLPEGHLTWDGGLGIQSIAVWYFIAMATLIEPAFHQRCYAAKTEQTARLGIFLSVALWIVFDFLTTSAGLYARALLPDLANPLQALPMLAEKALPPYLQAVFTVGLLATIMSTIDSYALIGAVTLGRDVIGRWRGLTEAGSMRLTKWSLLATAAVSVTLALWSGSVVELWKNLGSVGTPVLLLPLVAAHSPWRLPGRVVVASMLSSGSAALIWLALGGGGPWLGVEAIFPGLMVSVAVILWGIARGAEAQA